MYTAAVRRARVIAGTSYYIVPVRSQPDANQPTVRCLDAQAAALRHSAAAIPRDLRASTLHLGEAMIAYDRRLISAPPRDGVCMTMQARGSSGETCGATTAASLRRPSLPESVTTNGTTVMLAIVPDGVASVTVHLGARTFDGQVRGNLFVKPVTGDVNGLGQTMWRNAAGRVIARTPRPPRGGAASCARHRLPCLAVDGATSRSGGSGGAVESAASSSATATTPGRSGRPRR